MTLNHLVGTLLLRMEEEPHKLFQAITKMEGPGNVHRLASMGASEGRTAGGVFLKLQTRVSTQSFLMSKKPNRRLGNGQLYLCPINRFEI